MSDNPYMSAYKGYFRSLLRWEELDAFWPRLAERADAGWYLYAVGEPPPAEPLSADKLCEFIPEIDALLRREHEEDYCGIVYADDVDEPRFIKIYDPNNLGSSCGPGFGEVLPGWVLSTLPPVDLQAAIPPPNNRRRWWQRLFPG